MRLLSFSCCRLCDFKLHIKSMWICYVQSSIFSKPFIISLVRNYFCWIKLLRRRIKTLLFSAYSMNAWRHKPYKRYIQHGLTFYLHWVSQMSVKTLLFRVYKMSGAHLTLNNDPCGFRNTYKMGICILVFKDIPRSKTKDTHICVVLLIWTLELQRNYTNRYT